MKNFIFLLAFTVLTVPVVAATKAYKCTKLRSYSTEWTTTISLYAGKADWEATIDNITIKAVAACSNLSGEYGKAYSGTALPTVSSTTDTTNVNCWCKMTRPAVSSWVYSYTYTSAGECLYGCARSCASRVRTDGSEFRHTLYSTMID